MTTMTKDKALENLFLAQKPVFADKDEFMEKLDRRLEAVEYIKQYEAANLRRYKYAIVAAFVLGIASGGALLVFILSTPLDVPLFTFDVHSSMMLYVLQHSRIITSFILMLLMSFGITSIVNNILDTAKAMSSLSKKHGLTALNS